MVCGERLMFGHCCRWRSDAPAAGMESSPAIGDGIIPNGRFPATRLRALHRPHDINMSAILSGHPPVATAASGASLHVQMTQAQVQKPTRPRGLEINGMGQGCMQTAWQGDAQFNMPVCRCVCEAFRPVALVHRRSGSLRHGSHPYGPVSLPSCFASELSSRMSFVRRTRGAPKKCAMLIT